MSYFLTKEIRETNKSGVTYHDIMQRVAANVTRENPSQHPQIEGVSDQQLFERPLVFGTESREIPTYVSASRDGDEVVLQAGRVQGLTPGSIFNVFRPDEQELSVPQSGCAVELTAVDTLTSRAKLLEGLLTDIQPMSRTVEQERSYSFEPFPVYVLEPTDAKDYFGDGRRDSNTPVQLIAQRIRGAEGHGRLAGRKPSF